MVRLLVIFVNWSFWHLSRKKIIGQGTINIAVFLFACQILLAIFNGIAAFDLFELTGDVFTVV